MFPNQRLESPRQSQKINQRRLNRNYSVRKKRDLASNTQNTYSDFYLAFCVCFFFTTNIQIKCPEKENNIIDKCDKEVWKCFILRSHDYRQWSAVAGIVSHICVCVLCTGHTLSRPIHEGCICSTSYLSPVGQCATLLTLRRLSLCFI